MKNIIENMSWEELIEKYYLTSNISSIMAMLTYESGSDEEVRNAGLGLINLLEENHKNISWDEMKSKMISYLNQNPQFFSKTKFVMNIFFDWSKIVEKATNEIDAKIKNNETGDDELIKKARALEEGYGEIIQLLEESDKTKDGRGTVLSVVYQEEDMFSVETFTIRELLGGKFTGNQKMLQNITGTKQEDEHTQEDYEQTLYSAILPFVARNPIRVLSKVQMDNGLRNCMIFAIEENLKKVRENSTKSYLVPVEIICQNGNIRHINLKSLVVEALQNFKQEIDEGKIDETDKFWKACLSDIKSVGEIIFQDDIQRPSRKNRKGQNDLYIRFQKILEEIENRTVDGTYIPENKAKNLIPLLEEGKISLIDIPNILIAELGEDIPQDIVFSSTDNMIYWGQAIKESGKIKQFLRNGSDENRGNVNADFLSNMLKKGILNQDDVIELYSSGIIDKEAVKELEQRGQRILSIEKLFELYQQSLGKDNTEVKTDLESKKIQFLQYSKIYKEILDNDFSEEAIINELMDREYLQERDMIEFYLAGLIGSKQVGNQIINKMFFNRLLKPEDIKTLYDDGTITEESIINFFNRLESEEEKENFIMSVFVEDKHMQQVLINYLDCHQSSNESEKQGKPRKRQNKTGEKTETEEEETIVFGFVEKYKFLKDLDKDVEIEHLLNGFKIFRSKNIVYPNTDEPMIIVEPCIESRNGETREARNKATYIMSLSEFRQNQESFIQYETKEVTTGEEEGFITRCGKANLHAMSDEYKSKRKDEKCEIRKFNHTVERKKDKDKEEQDKDSNEQDKDKKAKKPKEVGWAHNVLSFILSDARNVSIYNEMDVEKITQLRQEATTVQYATERG